MRKRLLEQIQKLSEAHGIELKWTKIYSEDIEGLERCLRSINTVITNR
jgi:hypothetical protein